MARIGYLTATGGWRYLRLMAPGPPVGHGCEVTLNRTASGGASTQAFERRSTAPHAQVERTRPRLLLHATAGVAVGVTLMLAAPAWWLFGLALGVASVAYAIATLAVHPASLDAWRIGAEGEQATAAILAELDDLGYRVLHRRRIPGSRGTIDHLVVGQTGVYVVDTRSWSGDVRVHAGEVRIAGRRNRVVEQVQRQADAVAVALPCVQITPIVCVHRADLPPRPISVDGVAIVRPTGLLRTLSQGPTHLAPADIDRLVAQLDARLPSAA